MNGAISGEHGAKSGEHGAWIRNKDTVETGKHRPEKARL